MTKQNNTNEQELKELIKSFEELAKEMDGNPLDDEVYSVKDDEASNINNDGPEAQIRYLMNNGYTLKGLQEILKKAEDE